MRVVRKNQMFPFFTNQFENELLKEFYGDSTSTFKPAVNIQENDDRFLLEFVVPGFEKENFKIEVVKNQLIVSAVLKEGNEEIQKKYSRKEFKLQNFRRSFTIQDQKIDTKKVEAKYENGILEVQLPKVEKKEEKVKLIDVK